MKRQIQIMRQLLRESDHDNSRAAASSNKSTRSEGSKKSRQEKEHNGRQAAAEKDTQETTREHEDKKMKETKQYSTPTGKYDGDNRHAAETSISWSSVKTIGQKTKEARQKGRRPSGIVLHEARQE